MSSLSSASSLGNSILPAEIQRLVRDLALSLWIADAMLRYCLAAAAELILFGLDHGEDSSVLGVYKG